MINVYDVVFKAPALTAKEMPPALEQLAQALVKGGRLRIDADEKINFIRYPAENGNVLFFSHRELHDKFLVRSVESQIGGEAIQILRREIKTNQPVSQELELKLTRLFVQSNHISVIKLIILERVEVFLSYGHNIGDLLDLESWQTHGGNSGMQATGAETRIYVSAGADPFDPREEAKEAVKYALARFQIIAAQETGHYADLKRDARGRKTHLRFSLDHYNYAASTTAKTARDKDIAWINHSKEILKYLHLDQAAKLERSTTFFKKYRKYSLKRLTTIIKAYTSTKHLQRRALKFNFKIANLYHAKDLAIMVSDMEFNLSPEADVYKNKDKTVEEAIACVEALARVPQQVIKWGHVTTKFMYPNLYRVYYNEVIPAAIRAVKALSGNA